MNRPDIIHNIGALIIRIGFGAHYAIITILNVYAAPKKNGHGGRAASRIYGEGLGF